MQRLVLILVLVVAGLALYIAALRSDAATEDHIDHEAHCFAQPTAEDC